MPAGENGGGEVHGYDGVYGEYEWCGDAGEDEGYIMMFVYDKAEGSSSFVMLDHAALSLRIRSLWMELEFKENEKIMQAGLFGSELFQTEFLLTHIL